MFTCLVPLKMGEEGGGVTTRKRTVHLDDGVVDLDSVLLGHRGGGIAAERGGAERAGAMGGEARERGGEAASGWV